MEEELRPKQEVPSGFTRSGISVYLVMSSYTPYPVFLSWSQWPMKTLEDVFPSIPELSMP